MGAITPRYIKHLGKKLTESEVGPRYLGETGDSLYVCVTVYLGFSDLKKITHHFYLFLQIEFLLLKLKNGWS